MGVSGPSLLIESTDSMIIIHQSDIIIVMCKTSFLLAVIPELAANDQLMKFWMSIAKPDVSYRNRS